MYINTTVVFVPITASNKQSCNNTHIKVSDMTPGKQVESPICIRVLLKQAEFSNKTNNKMTCK